MKNKTPSDKRKRSQRDQSATKKKHIDRQKKVKQQTAEQVPSTPPPRKEEKLALKQVNIRIGIMVLLIFLGGLLFTIISVEFIGYMKLPNMGEVVQREDGSAYFEAYYPVFRSFAITDDSDIAGEENYFTRVGRVGTGLFFYSVFNAPHWIFELKFRNIGALFLVPFVAMLFATFYFFFYLIPSSMQTRTNAVTYSTFIGFLHAVLLGLIILICYLVWPNFAAFFESSVIYEGQMVGSVMPGLIIILLTDVLYGAIVGGILSFVCEIRNLNLLGRPR